MRRLVVFVTLAVGLAVWRYFAIPSDILPYDGKTSELTLEAAGYSWDSPYGKAVAVRLFGVDGTLYYSFDEAYQPGDSLTGSFRITRTPHSGSHFKAVTYDAIIVARGSPGFRYMFTLWAQGIKNRIQYIYPGIEGTFLTGVLTGDKSGFTDALRQDLFTAGLSHVAAVSGLHVSILAGFISLITRSRRRSFVITLPVVFVYVAVSGFSPSAVRAGIMLALFTLAPLLGREYTPVRALLAAFLLLCAINPYALFEPSMQLSFTSTLGLLLFAPRWQQSLAARFAKHSPVTRYLTASLAASFAALVFSIPFAAYWFDGVSLISPVSNLLLLWLVSVIFICGSVSLIIPFCAWVTLPLIKLFLWAVSLLGNIPYAVLYTAQPYLLAWLAYGYAMFTAGLLTRRWKNAILLTASSFVLCMLLTIWRDKSVRLEISVLDVGQGQCVVIRSGGQTAIYDCGGVSNAGQTAARFLQSRGVQQAEYLILSHYDQDHIGGVPPLLSMVKAERVLGPPLTEMPDDIDAERVDTEQKLMLGNAQIALIPALWQEGDNEQCLSAVVTIDDFAFLITGDLGQASERWLLRWAELPQIDVMVAGHHGSSGSTSAELLDTLQPQAVIISVGANIYGHPSADVLERLFYRNIAVYRTDTSGTVSVRY